MKHAGTKELETARLVLRRFTLADAEPVYTNWAHDKEVTKYLTWKAHHDVNATKAVLADWVSKYDKPDFYQWAIALKTSNKPIGSISVVQQRDAIKMVHIGYCIGKQWWGQGIVSEALSRLIKFFFEEVGINRIESRHDPRNPNSGKVMAKCGMRYEGTMRQADISNQGICDYSEYGLLAEEYFAHSVVS
jgi:ribosomal-protein-alanine N-acetyltransferase